MCGGIYEEELIMNEVKWYVRGETGERLLDLVDQLLDGNITNEVFVREAKFYGLSDEEATELLEAQVNA